MLALTNTTTLIHSRLELQQKRVINNTVTIKEFLVTQLNVEKGEFDGVSASFKNNLSELAEESTDHLLQRMLMHLHHVCMRAREVHINDHFIGRNSDAAEVSDWIPDHPNAITRITFSEFSFYPYAKRGPLTLRELNDFCQKLEVAATEYPVNMHLCLSTVPVVDEHNQVFNIGIYLQCGKTPTLKVFAKACPSDVDPVYIGTVNPYFSILNAKNELPQKIRVALAGLMKTVDKGDFDNVRQAIDELLACVHSHPEYLQGDQNTMSEKAQQIKALCEQIRVITKYRDTFDKRVFFNIKVELTEVVLAYCDELDDKYNDLCALFVATIQQYSVPQATIGSVDGTSLSLYRGGLIECETAGGVKFITGIDICYDNTFDVAARLYERYIENCLRDGVFITPYFSHIVTSNFIPITAEDQPGEVIVHCDAMNTSVIDKSNNLLMAMPDMAETITEPAFGGKAMIESYHPYVLRQIEGRYQLRISYYNKMIREKMVLEMMAQQSAKQVDMERLREFDERSFLHVMHSDKVAVRLMSHLLPDAALMREVEEGAFTKEQLISAIHLIDDINKPVFGNSFLHWIIIHGLVDVLNILLEQRVVDLHRPNDHGVRPFELAVMYNQSTMACRLYKHAIAADKMIFNLELSRSASSELKNTLLMAAIEMQREQDVAYLLSVGANPFYQLKNGRPINSLRNNFDPEVCRHLYEWSHQNHHLNKLLDYIIVYGGLNTSVALLELCCRDGHEDEVKYILSNHVDLLLTLSEARRLYDIIEESNNPVLYSYVMTHLRNLGYSEYIEEYGDSKRVSTVQSLN